MIRMPKGRIILWSLLAVLLVWDIYSWIDRSEADVHNGIDFLGYWASGRLFWQGANPYDPEALLVVEQSVGFPKTSAMIAWAPPWLHAFLWPFELLPFQVGKAIWFFFNLVILMWATTKVWRCYGGSGPLWIPWLTVLCFTPSFIALNHGSASPLVFVGLVGFVRCAEKRSDFSAGCFSALLALKPHVIYLFWPFLLLWIAKTRRWRALVGFSTVLLISGIITFVVNPDIYGLYLRGLFSDAGAKIWATPTISTALRELFPKHQAVLQYLPAVFGSFYGLIAWYRHKNSINLRQTAIAVAMLSALTAPYLWPGDFVVLMPVALLILLRFKQGRAYHRALLSILAVMQVIVFVLIYTADSMFVLFWIAPVLGILWILSDRTAGSHGREAVIQNT